MASLPATHPVIGTNEDDVLNGTHHSDVMSGQFGDDLIKGYSGNDEIWGGTGDDSLYGNHGHDKVYGSGGPALVQITSVDITDDYPVSVTFEGETAGYKNTFGYYKVEDDGTITDVELIWPNASAQGSGGDLIQGETKEFLSVQTGDKIAFFIVSNGYSLNDGYNGLDLETGALQFLNADGSIATLSSQSPRLYHTAEDGTQTLIKFNPYHTAAYGDTVGLNPDSILHTTGVLKSDAGTITIGFEDLFNGGDKDFDDSVFTVDIGLANALVLNAHFSGGNGGTDPDHDHEGIGSEVIIKTDNDILYGGVGSDELHGRSGDDQLFGENGEDELHGGSGEDLIQGGAANDQLFGNSGQDSLYGGNHDDTLNGNSEDDFLSGDNGDDSLLGGAGNDELLGGRGDDSLNGGSGDDQLSGEYGNDVANGGSGNDLLDGGRDNDTLNGGADNDTLSGGYGNDHLYAGTGDDMLYGGRNDDILNGGSGSDLLDGDYGHDVLNGGNGDDTLSGGHNNDKLNAGSGLDELDGGYGNDTLYGGGGDDALTGGAGNDQLFGGSGNDVIFGDAGNDIIHGGGGSNTADYSSFDADLKIWLHNNKAHGLQIGTDSLKYMQNINSGSGDDHLQGTSGINVINAGDGDDYVRSLKGEDILTGGGGADQFVYRAYDLDAADTITDFEIGTDVIDLSSLVGSGDEIGFLTKLETDSIGDDVILKVDLTGNGSFQEICKLEGVGLQSVTSLYESDCLLL